MMLASRAVPEPLRTDSLDRLLQEMADEIAGVRVLVVGDRNGLPLGAYSKGTRSMAATAVATLIVTAGQDLARTLELKEFSDVLVEGPTWKVFVRLLAGGFTLMGVLEGEVNLGMVRLAVGRRVPQIEASLAAFS